jgi:hypothetical protein
MSRTPPYRLGNQPTRARSQDFGERIIDRPFLTEGNNSILSYGVTLLLGGLGGLITNSVTPPTTYRHPVSPVAPATTDDTTPLFSFPAFQGKKITAALMLSAANRVVVPSRL